MTLEEQQAKHDAEIEKLNAKITEVIGINRQLKAKLSEGTQIDPRDYAELEKELSETKAKLTAADKAQSAALKDLESVKAQLETETKLTHTELKEAAALKAAMAAGVVDGEMAADLAFIYSAKATVELVDGKRVVKVGDLSIDEAVKAHPSINKYIPATPNGGGKVNGNNGGGSPETKTMKNSDFSQLSPKETRAFYDAGGRVVDD